MRNVLKLRSVIQLCCYFMDTKRYVEKTNDIQISENNETQE